MPDLKRMKQRRGNKSDLPLLAEGEIAITLDTKEMFYGLGNENIQLFTDNLTIDDLISTNTKRPLSANQGYILSTKITNLDNYYQQVIGNLVNDLTKKQDTMIHKASSTPPSTAMIWYDTSI